VNAPDRRGFLTGIAALPACLFSKEMLMTRTNGDDTTATASRKTKSRLTPAQHLEALETKPAGVARLVVTPKLDIRTMRVKIVGDAPLIVHKFAEKQRKQIEDRQTGVGTTGRNPKVPKQDFQDSLYLHPGGGYGFPAQAFKNAAVSACTSLGRKITKTAASQAFHVAGEFAKDLVKIEGNPVMRQDMVRIGQGKNKVADIRYRGEFKTWSCILMIRYNAQVLTDEQIIVLLNVAGFAVGVGEWRVEKGGQMGLFHCE
jgi:hypothetical protein